MLTLRSKRLALGWTITKLARISGNSRAVLCDLETGSKTDRSTTNALHEILNQGIAKRIPVWIQVMAEPYFRKTHCKANKLKALEFGLMIRDRRNAAKMTRLELAALMGVCEATIKNLEKARYPPSRRTCLALIAVPQLNLTWEDINVEFLLGPDPATIDAQLDTTKSSLTDSSDSNISGSADDRLVEEVITQVRRTYKAE